MNTEAAFVLVLQFNVNAYAYAERMCMKVEYKVRRVTRYVVTRFHQSDCGSAGGSETKGEYANGEVAYQVAYALAAEEHKRLGYPEDDERIQYPKIPDEVSIPPQGVFIDSL